jgi:type IV secretion system protein VirB3
MEQDAPIAGFYAPVHRALTEPILLGGAPRAVAIANGTLAAAVGLGLRLWMVGGAIWLIGHLAAVWAAKRDPAFVDVVRRQVIAFGFDIGHRNAEVLEAPRRLRVRVAERLLHRCAEPLEGALRFVSVAAGQGEDACSRASCATVIPSAKLVLSARSPVSAISAENSLSLSKTKMAPASSAVQRNPLDSSASASSGSRIASVESLNAWLRTWLRL